MSLLDWFKRTARPRETPRRRFLPTVEILEDRSQPSILTVTTAADNALAPPPGSLRALLAIASNGDTIDFAPSLTGQTIALQGSTLTISKNVTITSGGVQGIVISGSNAVTVFTVNSGVTATIDELAISNGLSSQGGGVLNNGKLTVSACTIAKNVAFSGGGIGNLGTLVVVNSTIADNSASSTGAGIFSSDALSVYSCTIVANDAFNGSGGGLSVSGTSDVRNSIVAENMGATSTDVSGVLTAAFNDLFSTAPSIVSGNSNLLNTNPKLDPNGLSNNGGPTETIAELPDSPTIAAGNAAFVTTPPFSGTPVSDQRGSGFLRAINYQTDIGAFEDQTAAQYVAYGSDTVDTFGEYATVAVLTASTADVAAFTGFAPWGPGFTGGCRVTTGDINGDGIPDLIVGSGSGGITSVLVYDGASVLANPDSPTLIAAFFPFGPHFSGGCFVAVGSLEGGPGNEIIVGADSGGGPQVNIYSAAQIQANTFSSPALAFYAFAPNFTGGVRVAVGDVNGDGNGDLIAAAGPGGGPQVNIYLGRAGGGFLAGGGRTPALAFFAFQPNYTGGVSVTAGDASSNGMADVFVGSWTGTATVAVYTGAQLFGATPNFTALSAFYVYGPFPLGPASPGQGGVLLAFTQSTFDGQENVPALIAASNELSTGQTYALEYDAQTIVQYPGAAPDFFSNTFQVYPFGVNNTPSGDQSG